MAAIRWLRPAVLASRTLCGGEFILKQASTKLPLVTQVNKLRTVSNVATVLKRSAQHPNVQQEVVVDTDKAGEELTKYVIQQVNSQINENKHGRLFAVAFVQGKQHLVTTEDLVVVQGLFPPNIGDVIRLEKILAVGGRDFTLFGRPLLSKDLVNIEATVVEKTLSHCRVFHSYKRRENARRTKFGRQTHTMLRINRIEITHNIDEVQAVEGVDGRIF
ncbi:large ribosomal subunit protein bL21m [Procambarus clarkii]|uniref:large ribosomal subunit protein bL21m n=1 Tax=Procambarus clarkii TaxID=6728 RepID=UPI001E6759B5|nr:39S ribosomal protein L21, mitochondrial-like [Procambarus clarkii]